MHTRPVLTLWLCVCGAAAAAESPKALLARAAGSFVNARDDLARAASNAREECLAAEAAAAARDLACVQLDWAEFRRLGGTRGAYVPLAADEPSEAAIAQVVTLLEKQRAAFFADKTGHAWVTCLFLETRGLLWRMLGDRQLREADRAFLGELAAAQEAKDLGGALIALYHLRRFEEVAQLAARLPDASGMARERALEVLACVEGALRFLGKEDMAKEIAAAISRLRDKAGQYLNPVRSVSTFITGSPTELAAAATTLGAAARGWGYQGRTRALLHFLAGSYALGAGDSEFALPLLREAAKGGVGGYLGALIERAGGECCESLGYYAEAAEAFWRARTLGAADREFAAAQAVNLVSALMGLNSFVAAERLLRDELAKVASPQEELWLRVLLGNVVFARGAEESTALEDAEAMYARALERLHAVPAFEGRAYLAALLEVNLGNAKRARFVAERAPKLLGEAEACMRRALGSVPAGERLAAVAAANLAEILLDRGDVKGGRELARGALNAARALRYAEAQWRACVYLGRAAEEDKDLAAAKEAYAEAVRIVEVCRGRLPTEEERTSFLYDKSAAYQGLVRVLLASGAAGEAFGVAERAKAAGTREALGLRELLLAFGPGDAGVGKLVRLMRRSATPDPSTRPFAEAASLADVRAELEALRARAKGSALGAFFGEAPDCAWVASKLDADETLLEYFPVGDRLAVWVITRSGVKAHVLEGSWRTLAARAALFVAKKAADAKLAEELGAALLAPLGELGPKLCIVPTGALHRVPFDALRVRGAYLVERAETRYAPSAALIAPYGEPAQAAPGAFMALANPDTDYDGDGRPDKPDLRAALQEVAAIGRNYAEGRVYRGAQATEALWRANAPAARVVHLACHGTFLGHDPWHSALFLATGGGEDGTLQAWELLGMDLRNAELVTLSGCETGVSRVEPGDDIAGLPRGFLLAGARALVASLWTVEDRATARLMTEFYQGAAKNQGLGASLRAARLALLRSKEFNSPKDWAAFVLFQRRCAAGQGASVPGAAAAGTRASG